MDYTVVNVVTTTKVDEELNLDTIQKSFDNCEYEPEVYFALIYRLKNPKASILVNKSGKLIITGSKSLEDSKTVLQIFCKDLIRLGYKPTIQEVKIQNIIATANFNKKINLESIALNLENTEYEPEQFPGLIYRLEDPKVVITLFRSGKLTCIGGKSLDDAKIGVNKTKERLCDLGLI